MTTEQNAAHEKRIDEFLAEVRRSFIKNGAEPVVCLGIDRNGKMVRVILEDTAPPTVVGTVLNSAMHGLHDRMFVDSLRRWVESLDRKAEIAALREEAKRLRDDIDAATENTETSKKPT